ncbi:MAG: ABC transporter permease [Tuberibacillus sp.]
MNPRQLFWKRWRFYYKKQWDSLKLLVDWTIMLYILIPFLIFLGINHYLWWQGPPDWSEWLPLPAILFVLLFAFINSQIFYFYEPADVLFLNQRSKWVKGLMKRGMMSAVIRDLILTFIVMLYVLPLFLVRYHLSWDDIFLLWLILFATRQFTAYLYQFLSFIFSGLALSVLNWMLKVLILVVIFTFCNRLDWSGGSYIILLGAELVGLFWMIFFRWNAKNKWVEDIDREMLRTDRLQSFLVGQAGVRKPLLSKKRPLFFRKSQGLFRLFNPVNGTAEIYLKNRLRDGRWLMFYWQMTVYSFIAIALFPGPDFLRCFLFIGTTCLFAYWLKNELVALTDHSFFHLVGLKSEIKIAAIKKVYAIMIWPGLVIQSAAIGFILYSWIGLLIACLCAFIYKKLLETVMLLLLHVR